MKIDFVKGVKLEELQITRAEQHWVFIPEEGPWEVDEDEWKYLKRFGLFKVVKGD